MLNLPIETNKGLSSLQKWRKDSWGCHMISFLSQLETNIFGGESAEDPRWLDFFGGSSKIRPVIFPLLLVVPLFWPSFETLLHGPMSQRKVLRVKRGCQASQ